MSFMSCNAKFCCQVRSFRRVHYANEKTLVMFSCNSYATHLLHGICVLCLPAPFVSVALSMTLLIIICIMLKLLSQSIKTCFFNHHCVHGQLML